MRRMPILCRPKPFLPPGCPGGMYAGLARLSTGCPPAEGRLHTCYSPVRRSPAGEASFSSAAPRLACVKPAASVHPEPGSNSPLLLSFFFFLSNCLYPAFRGYHYYIMMTLLLSVLWQYCHCSLLAPRATPFIYFRLPFSALRSVRTRMQNYCFSLPVSSPWPNISSHSPLLFLQHTVNPWVRSVLISVNEC